MRIQPISARDIAVSALLTQRLRMNLIANNIANAETTRTPEGGAFRRQLLVLQGASLNPHKPGQGGVSVKAILKDPSPLRRIYNPGHPDADAEGYVEYPNVSLPVEMADLVAAQRLYEANLAVLSAGQRIHQRALELIQR
jgi:flagellar basal-body rod protein FlgC